MVKMAKSKFNTWLGLTNPEGVVYCICHGNYWTGDVHRR